MTTTIVDQRVCPRCSTSMPRTLAFFPANKRMADGLSSWCRTCHREAKREATRQSPEKNRQRAAAWRQQHPERARQSTAAWRKAHPERTRANDRASHRRSIEDRRRYNREYRQANLERVRLVGRLKEARRRARLANAPGNCTTEQTAARVAFYGHRCWMCGAPWEHLDHVIPLVLGGSNWPSNIRPACRSCNSAKGGRHPKSLTGRS